MIRNKNRSTSNERGERKESCAREGMSKRERIECNTEQSSCSRSTIFNFSKKELSVISWSLMIMLTAVMYD